MAQQQLQKKARVFVMAKYSLKSKDNEGAMTGEVDTSNWQWCLFTVKEEGARVVPQWTC